MMIEYAVIFRNAIMVYCGTYQWNRNAMHNTTQHSTAHRAE
jgi:hypothetical protein